MINDLEDEESDYMQHGGEKADSFKLHRENQGTVCKYPQHRGERSQKGSVLIKRKKILKLQIKKDLAKIMELVSAFSLEKEQLELTVDKTHGSRGRG